MYSVLVITLWGIRKHFWCDEDVWKIKPCLFSRSFSDTVARTEDKHVNVVRQTDVYLIGTICVLSCCRTTAQTLWSKSGVWWSITLWGWTSLPPVWGRNSWKGPTESTAFYWKKNKQNIFVISVHPVQNVDQISASEMYWTLPMFTYHKSPAVNDLIYVFIYVFIYLIIEHSWQCYECIYLFI